MQVIKDNAYYLAIKDGTYYTIETPRETKNVLYKFVYANGKLAKNTTLAFNWEQRTTDSNGIITYPLNKNGESSTWYEFVQGSGTENNSIPLEANEFGVITKTLVVTKPLCTITASITTSSDRLKLVLSNGDTVSLSNGQTYSAVPYTTYTASNVSSYDYSGNVSSSSGTMMNDFTISIGKSYNDTTDSGGDGGE